MYENSAIVATYSYDANGNRASLSYPNGNVTEYAYNLANLVTALTNKKGAAVLSSFTYAYALDGNQVKKTDDRGIATQYTYDTLGRLTQEWTPAQSYAYSYDLNNNRTVLTATGTEAYITQYTYDINSRLTKAVKTTGSVAETESYFYDPNGNQISKLNNTTKPQDGTAVQTGVGGTYEYYEYDGFDRMVPLLEAAAQTFIGAMAGYTFDKIKDRIHRENCFDGALDLWQRGIHCKKVFAGDSITFDGLISPYVQLFPRDPYTNAERWNRLHSFSGKISAQEFSNLEFYAGSDDALRTGAINGETLVGLYHRYGYIGEGFLAVVPTSVLVKKIPDFFNSKFFGAHVRVKGTLANCPTQHGFVAQGMFLRAGIPLEMDSYKEIPYLKISSIQICNSESDRICSLLGSPWAATSDKRSPYLVQYGYFNNPKEMECCISNFTSSPQWNAVRVFYDTITAPSIDLSFSKQFIK